MPGPIHRNLVVKYFGTPDVTAGSVNEPRERQEHDLRFNETWTYRHLRHDPAGAVERIIYWRRYDYVGSMIRTSADGEWAKDGHLPEALTQRLPNDEHSSAT